MKETLQQTDEIIDIEEYAKAKKPVPAGRKYRIRIDDNRYVVDVPSMTGRQILALAGKTPPENFILTQKLHGGKLHTVELDEVVDFTAPGVERFNTLPRQVQEG